MQETIPAEPFLSSRPIDAVIQDNEEFDDNDEVNKQSGFFQGLYYVLDGQQRLTSLVRVFLQASKNEIYYFDLDQLYESDSFETNPASWVKKRKENQKLSMRYLRSDMIVEAEKCEVIIQEYFESGYSKLSGDRHGQRKAAAKVNRTFETMRNYQIPLVIIDRGDSTEAICRIFEIINSTGTRLTTFDLAVARFFPDPDLHKLWIQSKLDHPILEKFLVEGERVLQLIVSLVGSDGKKYIELTRGSLLKLKRSEIKEHWEGAARALAVAYKWIEDHGAVPGMIANDALLVPIAYFLNKITDTWKKSNPSYILILERWYFAHSLQQGARQASNYRIGLAVSALHNWIADGVLVDTPQVHIKKAELLTLFKSDSRYRAIHSLLRWRSNKDLWTDAVIDSCDVEDHHIFPAALAKRESKDEKFSKRNLDSIVNRMLVSRDTNRNLSDRYPSDYFGKLIRDAIQSGTLESKNENFRRACLPIGNDKSIFEIENFQKFIGARADLIINEIKIVVGDLLNLTELVDEDEVE